jgi:predicted DNA-binding protein YlxM (UPF0122 family)
MSDDELLKFRSAGRKTCTELEHLKLLIRASYDASQIDGELAADLLKRPQPLPIKPPSGIVKKLEKWGIHSLQDLQGFELSDVDSSGVGWKSITTLFDYIYQVVKSQDSSMVEFNISKPLKRWIAPKYIQSVYSELLEDDEISTSLTEFGINNSAALVQLGIYDLNELGISLKKLAMAIASVKKLLSHPDDVKVEETPEPFEVVSGDVLRDAFSYVVRAERKAKYVEREIEMLHRYYFDGFDTMEELGNRFNVSRERVRQVLEQCGLLLTTLIDKWRNLVDPSEPQRLAIEAVDELVQLKIRFREDFEGYSVYEPDFRLARVFGMERIRKRLRYGFDHIVIDATSKPTAERLLEGITRLTEYLKKVNPYISLSRIEQFGFHLSDKEAVKSLAFFETIKEMEQTDILSLKNSYCDAPTFAFKFLGYYKQPAHYSRILRYAVECGMKQIPAESFRNRLRTDGRFVSLGKTGRYGLEEWGVNTDSMKTLIDRTITRHNGIVATDTLIKEIQAIRPRLSGSSILAISLMHYSQCEGSIRVRTLEDEELVEFKRNRGYCVEQVLEFLTENEVATFKEIQEGVTDFMEGSIRHTLARPLFRSVKIDGKTYYEVDPKTLEQASELNFRKNDYLVSQAKAFLSKVGETTMEAVIEHLLELGAAKPSCYKALNTDVFVKSERMPGKGKTIRLA